MIKNIDLKLNSSFKISGPYMFLRVQNVSNGVDLYYADSDKENPLINRSVVCPL